VDRNYQTDAEWAAYEAGYEDGSSESALRVQEMVDARVQLFLDAERKRYSPRYGNQKLECTIEGCTRFQHARGWCTAHHGKYLKYGDPLASAPPRSKAKMVKPRCDIPWCHREARSRGLCHTHYHNWKKRDNQGRGYEYIKFLVSNGPPESRTGRDRGGVEVSEVRALSL
jgi:hypothetical protein